MPALIWLFEERPPASRTPSYRETARRLFYYNARHAISRSRLEGDSGTRSTAPPFTPSRWPTWPRERRTFPEQPSARARSTPEKTGDRLGDPHRRPCLHLSASATPAADIPPSLIATAPGTQNAYYVPDQLILRSAAERRPELRVQSLERLSPWAAGAGGPFRRSPTTASS